jgi:tripartite-type tricarboxylate transporter receptor subunit TctC
MAHISFDALAQEFPPKKTITIVVGFAPGGSADSAARVIAKKLSEDLGQNVLVAILLTRIPRLRPLMAL